MAGFHENVKMKPFRKSDFGRGFATVALQLSRRRIAFDTITELTHDEHDLFDCYLNESRFSEAQKWPALADVV